MADIRPRRIGRFNRKTVRSSGFGVRSWLPWIHQAPHSHLVGPCRYRASGCAYGAGAVGLLLSDGSGCALGHTGEVSTLRYDAAAGDSRTGQVSAGVEVGPADFEGRRAGKLLVQGSRS